MIDQNKIKKGDTVNHVGYGTSHKVLKIRQNGVEVEGLGGIIPPEALNKQDTNTNAKRNPSHTES